MAKVKALTDRTIAERFAEIKDETSLWGDIGPAAQRMVRWMVESSLEAELVARLGAERYKRTEVRRGWRNGGYPRQLVTCWGLIDIWMPRAREKLPPSQVLGRFQRRQPQVDQLIREAFLQGISTRQVGEVLEPVLGGSPQPRPSRGSPRRSTWRFAASTGGVWTTVSSTCCWMGSR